MTVRSAANSVRYVDVREQISLHSALIAVNENENEKLSSQKEQRRTEPRKWGLVGVRTIDMNVVNALTHK